MCVYVYSVCVYIYTAVYIVYIYTVQCAHIYTALYIVCVQYVLYYICTVYVFHCQVCSMLVGFNSGYTKLCFYTISGFSAPCRHLALYIILHMQPI